MARRLGATTGWWLLLVAALAATVWQLQQPATPSVDADSQPGALLVGSPLADWAAVQLLYRGERLRLERDASGRWLRHDAVADEAAQHSHQADPLAAERIGTVLAVLARARVERSLPSDVSQLASYGLANPALIVLVQGADGRALQTIELGDVAPDGLSRYVQLPQTRQVHTIPDYHASGLLSLLAAPGAAASVSAPAPASAP